MIKRTKEKLCIVKGRQSQKEVPLEGESFFIGRPDPTTGWRPGIDLSPDFGVSRKHCHLFFKDNDWLIEDIGSEHGTLVAGKEINALTEPTRLPLGVPVKTGDTVWKIASADLFLKSWNGLTIEFEGVPGVTYALYHCGIPIISNFSIRNHSPSPSPPVVITASIPGWSHTWRKRFDPLPPGKRVALPKIHLNLHYEKLEVHEGRKRARLEIKADGKILFSKEIYILGFYQWPYNPTFRRTLACFVQPAHPLVEHLVAEAAFQLKRHGLASSFTQLLRIEADYRVDRALKPLYESLRNKYDIHYLHYPPSHELESQGLRPPHRVILDPVGRMGGGTCIDLALLLASCLENIYFQPLIFFVKGGEKGGQHAFLGCWSDISERFKPILTDYEELKDHLEKGQLVLLEATGFTDRGKWIRKLGRKPIYEEAKELAEAQFTREKFIFALDIAAARQTIAPLQFPTSPSVTGIIRKAEELALKEKGNPRLETRHLFNGLFLKASDTMQNILREAGADLSLVEALVSKPERDEEISIRPTINYRRALEDARIIAGDCGVAFVEEEHLFYALLLSQSKSIDQILEMLGTDREKLKGTFEKHLSFPLEILQTYYE